MFSSGTSGTFEVRQRLINRNSRVLFSFTVNIVCNQQLWFSFDVSTGRLDFFPALLQHGYLDVDSGQHLIHIILKIVFINRYSVQVLGAFSSLVACMSVLYVECCALI